jgi:hypothetical protein
MEKKFQRGSTTITLSYLSSTAFEVYTTWLYTGKMCTDLQDERQSTEIASTTSESTISSNNDYATNTSKKSTTPEWNLLSNCLVLAHQIDDNVFYNVTVDSMIELNVATGKFPGCLSPRLYRALPAMSPALQLLVDFYVYTESNKLCAGDDVDKGPQEFWVAIAKGLIEKDHATSNEPWLQDRCRYHIHADGKPKCT